MINTNIQVEIFCWTHYLGAAAETETMTEETTASLNPPPPPVNRGVVVLIS